MADDNTPWDEMANAPGGPPKEGPTVVNFAAEKAKRADPKARKSQFFTATMLDGKEVPARNWLVPRLIPSGTVTLLTGDGGTGKSLLALQLATACALGKPWLGKTVAGGRALFVSAEDDEDELHRRLADVLNAEEASFADLDQLALRSLAGEDALLTELDTRTGKQKATDLFRELDAFLTDLAPALVVLDTLADLFPGNENDRAQARQFIGMLRGLAIRHDCAVVLLAHPSLSGIQNGTGMSGSTGWHNSVRSRLYLERILQGDDEPNPGARVLRTMKANYGPTGAEIALTWRNGVFVADEPETGLDCMARRSKAMRKFMELLRLFTEQGRDVNSRAGRYYAPTIFAAHPEAEGITKNAFADAMECLFSQGAIRDAEVDRHRRKTTIIQEVE
ncbi:AAA family ATPase [Paracoccus denitrificans]|uniref:AAA family ATPase n=1 Tax=Paracoccus denitrificans TaxID=266 RepID=UPI001F3C4A4F|nr:AAA family ATPase [Paracoccus denitrificans]